MKALIPIAAVLATALSCRHPGHEQLQTSQPAATPAAEAPAAVHGMVLFGTDTIYASHIPMYHIPHDWQALFAVRLSHPTVDAKALYLAKLAQGVQPLITIEPKPFVLPKLLDGRLTGFEASLYLGNFEGDNELLLENMKVEVTKVVYKQHLSRSTAALPSLTYLLVPFADGSAQLVHKIAAPDNFDHILQAKVGGASLASSPADLARPLVVTGVPEAMGSRLKLGQTLELSLGAGVWNAKLVEDGKASPLATVLKVTSDFYCTPGPDFSGPCD